MIITWRFRRYAQKMEVHPLHGSPACGSCGSCGLFADAPDVLSGDRANKKQRDEDSDDIFPPWITGNIYLYYIFIIYPVLQLGQCHSVCQ